MWSVAFILGLMGSLHCVGMCGPLAIAFCNREHYTPTQQLQSALLYNLGRTATYAILGFLFGSLGSILFLADLQQYTSILLGVFLIATFFCSINIDKLINTNSAVHRYHNTIKNVISKMMIKSQAYNSFQLGLVNGLLPCGLVYLALAGALASGSISEGVLFMTFFGFGTIPMLFALTNGATLIPTNIRRRLQNIIPISTLIFGFFLIYRGFAITMPESLNFWEALKNPIMCH